MAKQQPDAQDKDTAETEEHRPLKGPAAPAARPRVEKTNTLGYFRLLAKLGEGGMGTVYKARQLSAGREVALKVLSPEVLDTEKAQTMFRREVRAAAQLHHPNIVMAFDANEADGRHYLAMEYVDGPNLEKFVAEHSALPAGMACASSGR